MRSIRLLLPATVIAGLALLSTAKAQTATQTLNFNSGSFAGTLGGGIDVIVKSQTTDGSVVTQGVLNVTDLDIETKRDSSGNFLFPNSTSNNNTASTAINIAPTVIGINVPTANFNSPITGSMDVTAGDNTANGVVGVLDGGVPGSDGKWDDPGQTGILNGASANNINVALSNPINAAATVSGGINASIPNNITIPDIVDTAILNVDLVLKNSSTVAVNFEPLQSLSIANLTIGAAQPIALPNPLAGNFVDGAHPVPGAGATLDLSTGGAGLVSTTISGSLIADIMGTITGNLDLRAELSLIGLINFGVDFNDVVDGELSEGVVSLIDLNEDISLDDVSLPFIIEVLHDANTNVDFDDVVAQLMSGTLGLTLPIDLMEQDIVLDLPATSFQIQNQTFNADVGLFTNGSVILHNLEATLGGQIVLDINAELDLNATLLAEALQQNAINVVPEPGSVLLMAFAGVGLVGYGARYRRRKK